MFSANENIALRQFKRRVVSYVESTIPEPVLDAGTSVMAMQVQCRAPGCAPLETVICIIFPRLPPPPGYDSKENEEEEDVHLMVGVPESHKYKGGTYKFTILKPLAEVTQEDVYEALPPSFEGGRWTVERVSLEIRDVMLNQLDKALAEGDVEGRKLLAEYLGSCLGEYVEGGCVLPEIGKPFELKTGNRGDVEPKEVAEKPQAKEEPKKDEKISGMQVKQGTVSGGGNFVICITHDDDDENNNDNDNTDPSKTPATSVTTNTQFQSLESASKSGKSDNTPVNLRYKQKMNTLTSSSSVMQRLAEREHPPGIRRRGCPCCDPEDVDNVVDKMMLL